MLQGVAQHIHPRLARLPGTEAYPGASGTNCQLAPLGDFTVLSHIRGIVLACRSPNSEALSGG